ncbi:MAG: hypothetical protein ABJD11_01045 [Gemmatimonadota bacterium]
MKHSFLILVLAAAACAHNTQSGGASGPIKPNVDPARTEHPSDIVVRYGASGSARFALYRRDSVTVKMPSGESQTQNFGRTAFVTIHLTPGTPPDAQVSITLDSLRPDPDWTLPQAGLDSATGTVWTGHRLANGRLVDLTADRPSFVASQLRSQLDLLYPVLPAGGARSNAEWTDSSTSPITANAFEVNEVASSRYRADPAADRSTGAALQITSERSATFQGSGNQFGQELQLAGTSTDSLRYQLSTTGQVLGMDGTESTTMTITVPSVGQTVPAEQYAHFKAEPIQ